MVRIEKVSITGTVREYQEEGVYVTIDNIEKVSVTLAVRACQECICDQ